MADADVKRVGRSIVRSLRDMIPESDNGGSRCPYRKFHPVGVRRRIGRFSVDVGSLQTNIWDCRRSVVNLWMLVRDRLDPVLTH
jgi:hypothetical protein